MGRSRERSSKLPGGSKARLTEKDVRPQDVLVAFDAVAFRARWAEAFDDFGIPYSIERPRQS